MSIEGVEVWVSMGVYPDLQTCLGVGEHESSIRRVSTPEHQARKKRDRSLLLRLPLAGAAAVLTAVAGAARPAAAAVDAASADQSGVHNHIVLLLCLLLRREA